MPFAQGVNSSSMERWEKRGERRDGGRPGRDDWGATMAMERGHQTRQSGTLVSRARPSSLGGMPKAATPHGYKVTQGNSSLINKGHRRGHRGANARAAHRHGSRTPGPNGSGLQLAGVDARQGWPEDPDWPHSVPDEVAKMQVEERRGCEPARSLRIQLRACSGSGSHAARPMTVAPRKTVCSFHVPRVYM